MKIFTITHKEFLPPPDDLYVPVHVGHIKYMDGTLPEGSKDFGYIGDDTGDNISAKNHLYGELTGLYWIWKNVNDVDYAGLVHYRRYFANAQGRLMTEAEYRSLFEEYDVIIAKHMDYEVSYAKKFAEYHHMEDLNKTGEVIKRLYPEYYDTFEEVINSKEQYLFNMMVAPKKLLDNYAKWLFDICFELENIIDVSGYDQYRARIYGFLSEQLLYVWIKNNGLKYYEAPVIYSQEKAETIEFKKCIKDTIAGQGYKAGYDLFIKTHEKRPDLTLLDADFTQELRLILAMLQYAVAHPEDVIEHRYFDEQLKRMKKADDLLYCVLRYIQQDEDRDKTELATQLSEGVKLLDDYRISKDCLMCLMNSTSDYEGKKEQILDMLLGQKADCEKVSVIVLNLGDTEAVKHTVDSVNRQSIPVGECIVFDVDDSKYETFAQVKNDAVKCTSYDKVLCIHAGTILPQNALEVLLDSGEIVPKQAFDTYMYKGDDAFSLLLVSKKMFDVIGGWNGKLAGAEDYELLLRICDAAQDVSGVRVAKIQGCDKPVTMETYYTYAYVLGKYAATLKLNSVFDDVFMTRYNEAVGFGIGDYFVANAEKMISRSVEYETVDREIRPVMVITGESVCYGVLDEFAKDFAGALIRCGQPVIELSLREQTQESLMKLAKHSFRAVVGFQTALFTTNLSNGELVGNLFDCPKYNFVFDHPLYISYHLMLPIKDYYILAQDEGYAKYADEYFDCVKKAYHLPPAGNVAQSVQVESVHMSQRKYDVTFVGTYNNYRERFADIRCMEKEERKLALRLLNYMKHHPNVAVDDAFAYMISELGLVLERREFVVRLHRMMNVGRVLIFYYREKVVKKLLDAGITLHVFSDSWKNSPFAEHTNLIIHKDLTPDECLEVYADSRISLNIMSWHKGGMTERVANTMLNGAVCVTDKTSYLERNFKDGEDIVLFDLEQCDSLAEQIEWYLKPQNKESLIKVAEAGRKKALAEHTWDNRAIEFLDMLKRSEEDL